MSTIDLKYGKTLTGSVLFRGKDVSTGEVETQLKKLTDKYSSQFVEWIPNRMMASICAVNNPAYRKTTMQGAALLNTTSISQSMSKISANFEKMFARKAYVHWYTGEGMDVAEFDEALMNVKDLISEYHQYQEGGPDEDEDNEV